MGGTISSCVSFTNSRCEQESSVVKSNLMASVLILTGSPGASLQSPARDLFVQVIQEILLWPEEKEEIILTAHQCVRMLLSLPEKRANFPAAVTLGHLMTQALIPTLLQHTLQVAKAEKLDLLDQDIKTLTSLPQSMAADKGIAFLAILLPTLTALLEPAQALLDGATPGPVHVAVMPHLLQLASTCPDAFRDTIQRLPTRTRAQLEGCVRHSVLSSQQKQQQQERLHQQELQRQRHYEDTKQPTIHLKTDFSNFT